jgi:hypothetical protein
LLSEGFAYRWETPENLQPRGGTGCVALSFFLSFFLFFCLFVCLSVCLSVSLSLSLSLFGARDDEALPWSLVYCNPGLSLQGLRPVVAKKNAWHMMQYKLGVSSSQWLVKSQEPLVSEGVAW